MTGDQKSYKGNLRFDASVLARLGEELIPRFDQGIVELVRNAYDADATECVVELVNTEEEGGKVIVRDDGIGMDWERLKDGWLVIGRSEKIGLEKTEKKERAPVGDKGLGRLAALRLGTRVAMFTSPLSEGLFPNLYAALINWGRYDRERIVEEVDLPVRSLPYRDGAEHGTEIRIKNLRKKINPTDVQALARSLSLLANPFDDMPGFKVKLIAPGHNKLEQIVSQGYLNCAEFRVFSWIDQKGLGYLEVYDWKGDRLWSASSEEFSRGSATYSAPAADFELWMYSLDGDSFTKRQASVSEVKSWLKSVGGVHFYYRQFRVYPYGEPGHDWLDMNLARSRNPELRPSTNNSIGRVIVQDPDGMLRQKTDRLGFVEEDLAFSEIRRFAQDVLEWVSKKRVEQREAKKDKVTTESKKEFREGRKKLRGIVKNEDIPKKYRDEFKEAFDMITNASRTQEKMLREDLKLYRALATAGATATVFSHEVGKPLSEIPRMLGRIEEHFEGGEVKGLRRKIEWAKGYLKRVASFASFQLSLVENNKRKIERVNVDEVIEEVVSHIDLLLWDTGAKILLEKSLDTKGVYINGSVSLIESIVVNCITNSVNALRSPGSTLEDRKILMETYVENENIILHVNDNGPGINDISKDEVWLPGVTTREEGTGFGLSIIKDSIRDLGGTYGVEERGKLGGAFFFFGFPVYKG